MAVDVLVTGAAGALGRHLVADLRNSGKSVIACGRDGGEAEVVWDITTGSGPDISEAPHTIVHAAAKRASMESNKRDEELWATNVGGTARVVEWGLKNGVKRIVLVSGALVYGDWSTPRREDEEPNAAAAGYYALSKWAAEQIALAACKANCEVTIVRLASLYGPEYKVGLIRHFLKMAKEDRCVRVDPPLDDAFDLIHLKDASQTIVKAVDYRKAGLWNAGGGGICSLMQIAEVCASVAGATVERSRRKAKRKARILNWVDDSLARNELGHRNTVTLSAGVKEIFESADSVQAA